MVAAIGRHEVPERDIGEGDWHEARWASCIQQLRIEFPCGTPHLNNTGSG